MYQRKTHMRRMGILCAVILTAGVLQWGMQHVKGVWQQNGFLPLLASMTLYWQTGLLGDLPSSSVQYDSEMTMTQPDAGQSERQTDSAEAETTAQTSATLMPLQFSAQEAENIHIAGACTYAVDETALLQEPLPLKLEPDVPQVLIVHTHTTEAYTKEAGQDYTMLSNARTLDEQYNMIRVGEAVAAILEQNGIHVIHDTTINDYPNYNGAYDRMKTIIEQNLAQYPSIQMVLDIHRDAAADTDGNPLPLSASFQDESYAKIMLVVGTDEGGLTHPNWQQNLNCALKLQALLNRDWPGLCRDLDLRQERFNQNQTPGSLLVEFGTDGNTLTEALRAAEVFGESLAQLLLDQMTS